jgi:hypothetical protein
MSSRYFILNVTVPGRTQINNPITTTWQLEDQILTRLECDIPPGHNGGTGIRILRSQQQVIPWANNQFLVANDRLLSIDYGEELTESKLVIITYNTDVYDHTFYLRATMTDRPLTGAADTLAGPVIPTASFTSAGVPSP